MKKILLSSVAAIAFAGSASALELSVYTGFQEAPHSNVTLNDPTDPGAMGADDFTAGWEGRSFEMPPYYGIRATIWRNENVGYALEFTHAKVYSDDETLTDTGYEELEFTDGLNSVIASFRYRWPGAWADGKLTPYVNAGLGVSIPYVEVQTDPASTATDGLQFGGYAGAFALGIHYDFNERWGMFGEYRFTYQQVDVDLDGGGSLDTDVITNALNIGVSYNF